MGHGQGLGLGLGIGLVYSRLSFLSRGRNGRVGMCPG